MTQTAINAERAASRRAIGAAENKYLSFATYMLVATLVVASVAAALYLLWYAADLLLLVFAGLLISILLRGVSRFVSRKTGIGRNLSIGLVALALLVLIALIGWLAAGRIGTQIEQLRETLPQAIETARNYLGQYEWAREAVSRLPSFDEWLAARGGTLLSRVTGLASTTFSGLLNTIVIVVLSLYFAFQPAVYTSGIKHLLPFRFRKRADEVFGVIDESLWRWLGGRFLLMFINAVLTGLGLWFLGVPLALTLGLIAGLLNFIPTFGPWIAAIPAVLVAFLQSPQQALYVAVLYFALQSLDGYVLTPLVDRKSVEMPPVLGITAMLLLGAVFGILGLLLASPLVATAMILIKMLYVEDIIGDPIMNQSKNDESGNDAAYAKNEHSGAKQTGGAAADAL